MIFNYVKLQYLNAKCFKNKQVTKGNNIRGRKWYSELVGLVSPMKIYFLVMIFLSNIFLNIVKRENLQYKLCSHREMLYPQKDALFTICNHKEVLCESLQICTHKEVFRQVHAYCELRLLSKVACLSCRIVASTQFNQHRVLMNLDLF